MLLRISLDLETVADKVLPGHLAIRMSLVELPEVVLDVLLGQAQLLDQAGDDLRRSRHTFLHSGLR